MFPLPLATQFNVCTGQPKKMSMSHQWHINVSSVVYEENCNCGENYIGETGPNVTRRWDELSDMGKTSERAKHLYQFPEHKFNWKIPRRFRNKVRQRKFNEAYYIMCLCTTFNNQLELAFLTLFQNGIT